jgi:hypothetical protein
VEFGVGLFHLLGALARSRVDSKMKWVLSLIGAPHDAKYALNLLPKVYTHDGLRAPLAALLVLALPESLLETYLNEKDVIAMEKRLAFVETQTRSRIPDSPFLYWYVLIPDNALDAENLSIGQAALVHIDACA